MRHLCLLIAALFVVCEEAFAYDVGQARIVSGGEIGQGYFRCYGRECSIVAPSHVVVLEEADAIFEGGAGGTFKVNPWPNVRSDELDLVVLSGEILESNNPGTLPNSELDEFQMLMVEPNGSLRRFDVRVVSEKGDKLIVEGLADPCEIQRGRSGSMIIDRQYRYVGMLLEAGAGCRGEAISATAVNEYLFNGDESYGRLRIASHTFSNTAIDGAYCLDESVFSNPLVRSEDFEIIGGDNKRLLSAFIQSNGPCTFGVDWDVFNERKDEHCREWVIRAKRVLGFLESQKSFDVNRQGLNYYSLLASAVSLARDRKCGTTEIIKSLVSIGADVNQLQVGFFEERISHIAARANIDILRLVIEDLGADPNLPDAKGLTPLMRLAYDGDKRGCYSEDTDFSRKLEFLLERTEPNLRYPASHSQSGKSVEEVLLWRIMGEGRSYSRAATKLGTTCMASVYEKFFRKD